MEPPPSQAQPHSLFEAETQAHVTALLMLHGALMLPLRTALELHGHACAFGVVELELDLAAKAEEIAAQMDVSAHRTFQAQRRVIREALASQGVSEAIDALVVDLLKP